MQTFLELSMLGEGSISVTVQWNNSGVNLDLKVVEPSMK